MIISLDDFNCNFVLTIANLMSNIDCAITSSTNRIFLCSEFGGVVFDTGDLLLIRRMFHSFAVGRTFNDLLRLYSINKYCFQYYSWNLIKSFNIILEFITKWLFNWLNKLVDKNCFIITNLWWKYSKVIKFVVASVW